MKLQWPSSASDDAHQTGEGLVIVDDAAGGLTYEGRDRHAVGCFVWRLSLNFVGTYLKPARGV